MVLCWYCSFYSFLSFYQTVIQVFDSESTWPRRSRCNDAALNETEQLSQTPGTSDRF